MLPCRVCIQPHRLPTSMANRVQKNLVLSLVNPEKLNRPELSKVERGNNLLTFTERLSRKFE